MPIRSDEKFLLPVKDILVTQPFGVNYANFYTAMGLKGHNGVDFLAHTGCKVLAAHDGVVTFAGEDGDGGISVTLTKATNGNGFKTIYYHLEKVLVKVGDKIKQGQIIGLADNTGKYTTGSHLHFGLKAIKNNQTENYGNGYKGALDPAPYFANMHGSKWYEPAAYHRYGRRGDYYAEIKVRFKNAWLHRQLIKINRLNSIYDNIFINRLTYGAWSYEEAINPAMNHLTNYVTKAQFENGVRPFV
jgi:hypothetical protein